MTELELIEEYRRRYPDDAGLRNLKEGRLKATWKKHLFGAIGKRDSVFTRLDAGRGKGRPTLYRPEAVERLHYILVGYRANLGVDRIKKALELGITESMLAVCADPWNARYLLTRPLTMLLSTEDHRRLTAKRLHLWLWTYDEKAASRLLMKINQVHPDKSAEDIFETDPRARRAIPLSFFLEPPHTPEDYVQDLRHMPEDAFRQLQEAMQVAATTPNWPKKFPQEAALIGQHVATIYDIRLQAHPVRDGKRPLHVLEVKGSTTCLTMLQQACSHLYAIQAAPQQWVQICESCSRYFPIHHPHQRTCQTSGCKL